MLISDIVKENSRIAHLNDVQLSWYPNSPHNTELAKGYQFTAAAEPGKKSSVEVLEQIFQSYVFPRPDVGNRFVVMATYGHGKTHLALALANFFGKPAEAPEIGYILANVKHAAGETRTQNLRDFKTNNAPLLVIRLFGDDPTNLPTQFVNGLKKALSEHPATASVELPFWFESARKFLSTRSSGEVIAANAFMEAKGFSFDLPGLLKRVEASDTTVYGACYDLFIELVGTPPDFGGEKPVNKMLEWAVDTYCGDSDSGKPFRGLLVLMDEFIAFVQSYAEKGSTSRPLQSLLDGISNQMGKACFIAFAQREPISAARDMFGQGKITSDRLADIQQELTRLPPAGRSFLHSSLEFVLDSYLDQNDALYADLREKALDALDEATDTLLDMVARYEKRNGWGADKVSEFITEGCFPLHPLTTGLLCTVQLQAGAVARNVLGYVLKELRRKGPEPALVNGPRGQVRPNWVYPVTLVDYFGEMMGDEMQWDRFKAAQAAAGARLPVVVADTLKAIYLQEAANIIPRTQDANAYALLVADLTGHTDGECTEALKTLTNQMVIEKDPVRPLYKFFQAGGASKIRSLTNEIEQRIANKKLDRGTIARINEDWKATRLPRIEVNGLSAGNAIDYAAHSVLLTLSDYTPTYLKGLAEGFRVDKQFIEGRRGVVLYLLAKNDDEVEILRTSAQTTLNSAFPAGTPIPFIVARPRAPRPELEKRILREIEFRLMSPSHKSEYGTDACDRVEAKFKKDIDEDMNILTEDVEFLVPAPYQAAMTVKAPQSKLDPKLRASYELAYPKMPPSFRNQVQESNPSLRSGVRLVAEALISNTIRQRQSDIDKNALAKAIVKDFLQVGGTNIWGVIGYADQVQLPTNAKIKAAWDHLDTVFKPGTSNIPFQNGLLPLLNTPFGYDYNTATLLFCAWFGYNRAHLRVEETGKLVAKKEMLDLLAMSNGKPSDFIKGLCFTWSSYSLTRVDPSTEEKKIQEQIQRVRAIAQGTQPLLTAAEAGTIRTMLLGSSTNNELSKALREEAAKVAEQIASGIAAQDEYEKREKDILAVIGIGTNPKATDIIMQVKQVANLPKLTCVEADQALNPARLRLMCIQKLQGRLEALVATWTKLDKLEDFKEKQTAIKNYQNALVEINDSDGQRLLQKAMTTLEEKRSILQAEQDDKETLMQIESMNIKGASLKSLIENETRLKKMKVQSEKARTKLATALKEVKEGIEALTQFADTMSARLDSLISVAEAQKLKTEIDRKFTLYEGLNTGKELDVAANRCLQLIAAFTTLHAQVPLNTPTQFTERIASLESAVKTAGESLATGQMALFSKAIASLNAQIQQKEREAMVWLERQEAQLQNPDTHLSTLLRDLERPHAFLPASHLSRVDTLINAVHARRDANEVDAIVDRFKEIKNPTVRNACLKQLIAYAQGIGEWK
jgi:hypothetical protein